MLIVVQLWSGEEKHDKSSNIYLKICIVQWNKLSYNSCNINSPLCQISQTPSKKKKKNLKSYNKMLQLPTGLLLSISRIIIIIIIICEFA